MRALALLPLAAVGALATPARAEGERALSVSLGWATFSIPGTAMGNKTPPSLSPDVGGSLSASYEMALGSDFSLRGELAGGVFYGGAEMGESNTSFLGLADAGAVYRFDVLKYVPYAFGGIGGVYSSGGPIDVGLEPMLVIGGGLDVLVSRDRSWGVEGRLASFISDLTVFTLGVRGTVRWGYF